MLKSQKNVALVKNSSEAVGAKNLLPVHTEKNVSVEAKNVSPQQNEKSIESRDKACLVRTKEARKRYLERLREAYAEELFSKFLNELSGTLTMKNHKGTWYLVFSCQDEKIKNLFGSLNFIRIFAVSKHWQQVYKVVKYFFNNISVKVSYSRNAIQQRRSQCFDNTHSRIFKFL